MSDCARFERSLSQLMADEIGPEEHAWLLGHVDGCMSCEKMFEVHLELSDPALALAGEDEEDLLGVRRAVIREIRHREAAPPRAPLGWLALRPGLLATGVAGLVLVALAAGWFGRGAAAADGAVLQAIDRQAARNVSLRDSFDSPYSYRDVRVRDAGSGRVAVEFEVATHVALERPKDDPLVAEILVQAMLQEESLGGRLQAVSQTAGVADPRVQDALIAAMLGDPSMPVRLRALSRLAEAPVDTMVRDAMLQVVAEEESVQMRLLAIDFLTSHEVPRGDLTRAIDAGQPAQQYAVYARARTYLEE